MNHPNRILNRMRGAAVLGVLLWASACDGLLEVDTPSRIPAEELEAPANAELLVNGMIGDFECAAGAYVVMGGLIGDELVDATQTADRYPYDRRNISPADRRYSAFDCAGLGVYLPLNRARASADNNLARLEAWTDAEVPNRQRLIGLSALHAGYSLVLLGEGFCSGTISSLDASREIVYGPELTPAQLQTEAEARFTRAIAAVGTPATSADSSTLNAARLGRARARLNLGRYAEARADAALIPAGFRRNLTASGASARRENRVWAQNGLNNEATSVGDLYRRLRDPRVPTDSVPRSATDPRVKSSVTGVALWRQGKYSTAAAPIPLARYEEAHLIIAEVDARAGNLPSAIAILNQFRTRGGQPAFAGTTQAEVLAEVVEQRRRELFLEGHHLGDLIRFNLPFTPAPGTPYHGGGAYGDSRCMPLPDIERNNNPLI